MEEKNSNRLLASTALLLLFAASVLLGIYIDKKYNKSDEAVLKKDAGGLDFLVKEIEPPVDVIDFSLIDHRGDKFGTEDLKGKWTFLFFGYTFCPEICPTTINTLDKIYRDLKRGDISVLFITFDPARDTVNQLSEYIPYFNEDFTGLSGSESEIKALADSLDIKYSKYVPEGSNEEDYQFYHDTAILLINPLGRLAARFSAPHSPKFIAEKFDAICKGGAGHSCSVDKAPDSRGDKK